MKDNIAVLGKNNIGGQQCYNRGIMPSLQHFPELRPKLVLSPRYTPDSIALWKAAIQAGWSVERLQSHRPPDGLLSADVVIYGEAIFANVIADAMAVVLLEPPFHWLTTLPDTYLRRQVYYTNLNKARELDAPAFIKPAYDKSFDAQVYESGADLPAEDILPGTMPVLVAEPISWEVEFRCFVLNRTITTLSIYSRGGQLAQAEDGSWPASDFELNQAAAFASTLLVDHSIPVPPALAFDVGIVTDRGWAVVEANPAWASGLYGCDAAAVLPVLRRACIKQTHLSVEDRPWVVERLV